MPANHPIRLIKSLAEVALEELSPFFEQMYSEVGRPSIPPERLLKASLLMALYTVRSERMFCEQLDYNLLFRWFLDLNWDEPPLTIPPSAAIRCACSSMTWRASFPARWSRKLASLS
jgi:transposase